MTTSAMSGGRIITFYSYKGGTGRSMALANVAWILACAGKRVLIIDWDLEAPGQHRYLYPFLEDKELESTAGVIDFLTDFATAARVARRETRAGRLSDANSDNAWYDACTGILRYACPVLWDFPGGGALDLMPAGRQDTAYPLRVTAFNWQEFYDVLGGGVFLEKLKQGLRNDYDYVLVDSRTGISDTAGICTVQMPDTLVVCFTLNRQSIFGTSAVALSAENQRRRPNGEPGLHIWPVATRVELAEKDRLESARDLARQTFQRYLGRLKREERLAYWGETEVLYQPYFAYEEVLAVFAERRAQTASMLASMVALARRVTSGEVSTLEMSESLRKKGLDQSLAAARRPKSPRDQLKVFLSYPRSEAVIAQLIISQLDRAGYRAWSDYDVVQSENWMAAIQAALESSEVFIVVIDDEQREWQRMEIENAISMGLPILPIVIAPRRTFANLPSVLSHIQAILLDESNLDEGLSTLLHYIELVRSRQRTPVAQPLDPEDPQKGQWGGSNENNGRRLTAAVKPVTDDWFSVALAVEWTKGEMPLEGSVKFHLHPTFAKEVVTVEARNGRAELQISAWGAFTVGAAADNGRTRLELDLSLDPTFPEAFRNR